MVTSWMLFWRMKVQVRPGDALGRGRRRWWRSCRHFHAALGGLSSWGGWEVLPMDGAVILAHVPPTVIPSWTTAALRSGLTT